MYQEVYYSSVDKALWKAHQHKWYVDIGSADLGVWNQNENFYGHFVFFLHEESVVCTYTISQSLAGYLYITSFVFEMSEIMKHWHHDRNTARQLERKVMYV